jgi:hypothetical protein
MKGMLLLLALTLLAVPAAFAADQAPAATAQMCTGVKDRAPVGVADKFPTSVGELYCYSLVTNATDKVVQLWIHGDKEVFKIELPVKAARWRTWSVKKILPGMTGAWRVEVRDAAGLLLATAKFTVE